MKCARRLTIVTSALTTSFSFQLSRLPATTRKATVAFGVSNSRRYDASRTSLFSSSASTDNSENVKSNQDREILTPWNDPNLAERAKSKGGFRSRQHVNPLSRRFQMRTLLTPDWPRDMFDDLTRPLFLDIGCSRGGFLVEAAKKSKEGGNDNPVANYNFLGLEIRPIVVKHAQDRVQKHNLQGILGVVGCNANVDLERLLTLAEADDNLQMVTIQFPDPHFKAQHAKRRVVTPQLVTTLARFMPPGGIVFLQSDIQMVLDEMREQFRNKNEYFQDSVEDVTTYGVENIFGIPTEREVSVLQKDLPVYRALFTRTKAEVSDEEEAV